MTALIEGINGKPVNMIRHIPFEVYADERITLNGPAFYDAGGEGGSQERASPEGGVREVRRRVREKDSPLYISTAARWLSFLA